MVKALPERKRSAGRLQMPLNWRRRMSDHVAYGLLVYTGLQIFVTVGAIEAGHGSLWPYVGLIVLVAAIIPVFRALERRWAALDDAQAADPSSAPFFRRDVRILWLAAIGLPFAICGLFKLIAALS